MLAFVLSFEVFLGPKVKIGSRSGHERSALSSVCPKSPGLATFFRREAPPGSDSVANSFRSYRALIHTRLSPVAGGQKMSPFLVPRGQMSWPAVTPCTGDSWAQSYQDGDVAMSPPRPHFMSPRPHSEGLVHSDADGVQNWPKCVARNLWKLNSLLVPNCNPRMWKMLFSAFLFQFRSHH